MLDYLLASWCSGRVLSEDSDDEEDSDKLFNVAIATIFAREVLEGAVIIGNYRTVILKSDKFNDARKQASLRAVTWSATVAGTVAVLVAIAVAIPLAILSNDLDERAVQIIEGISKVVAAICIVQLSVKLPVWLGIYKKVSLWPWKKYDPAKAKNVDNLSIPEIRFNVAWNIWREVAECGVFLIPFFLGTGTKAIPVSAVVGTAVALILGLGIYMANHRCQTKHWLAFFMAGLTLFLSVGLFVGGCHEFEEVWGETRQVWEIDNEFFSHKEFPFVLLKPFGWSSSRTVLQITTFWLWLALGCAMHFVKWHKTQRVIALYGDNDDDDKKEDKATFSEDLKETKRAISSSADPEFAGSDGSSSTIQDAVGECQEEDEVYA